jgi:hypothetical protein
MKKPRRITLIPARRIPSKVLFTPSRVSIQQSEAAQPVQYPIVPSTHVEILVVGNRRVRVADATSAPLSRAGARQKAEAALLTVFPRTDTSELADVPTAKRQHIAKVLMANATTNMLRKP